MFSTCLMKSLCTLVNSNSSMNVIIQRLCTRNVLQIGCCVSQSCLHNMVLRPCVEVRDQEYKISDVLRRQPISWLI